MADLASGAELSVMGIVPTMALHALTGGFLSKERLPMAISAFDLAVLLDQRIAGLLDMVERLPLPVVGRVAKFALPPEGPSMIVILPMAIDTDGGDIFEKKGLMASRAANRLVLSEEGKARFLMIEFLNLLPGLLDVAPIATIAQLLLVFVVFPMTGAAFV